jgi:cytochrome P450 family 135
VTLPPGPRMPAPVQILAWGARPTAFLEGCLRRYGDAFTLRLLGFGERGFSDVVFVTDPDAVKTLFTAGPDKLVVGELRFPMEPIFGPTSILLLDGRAHMRQRKLLLPPFHGERMAAYSKLIAEATEREIGRWPTGRPFALQPSMQRITLEVILQAVFGLDDEQRSARVGGAIKDALEMVANPLSELLMGLPGRIGPVNIREPFERKVGEMDAILLAEIARRRADPALDQRDDILSLLLQARDEDGEPMTDRELRDELVTLLLAGHETTATGLAWTFDELFRHPTALDRLRSGDGGYLDAVIKESLRLHPPISFVDRKLRVDLELAARRLPAGTIVAPCIYLTTAARTSTPSPGRSDPSASWTISPRPIPGCPSAVACAAASARASRPWRCASCSRRSSPARTCGRPRRARRPRRAARSSSHRGTALARSSTRGPSPVNRATELSPASD